MGNNFFTPWDTSTLFKPANMNPVPQGLDRGITYLKNVIVHCDGEITYNRATGILAWSDVLRIHFNRADGQAILNTVSAGSIAVADNEFVYADLNETNNTVLTLAVAAITTGAASNFVTYNRIVLGYRNTASDIFYPVLIRLKLLSLKVFTYQGNLADDATFNLPAIANSARGWIIAGSNEERSDFWIDATGTVVLTNNSTNVVANADTDVKLCVGTAGTQEPLTIKNRLGGTKNINLMMWYD